MSSMRSSTRIRSRRATPTRQYAAHLHIVIEDSAWSLESANSPAGSGPDSGLLIRALSDYSRSIALNPAYAPAYHNRANAFAKFGILRLRLRRLRPFDSPGLTQSDGLLRPGAERQSGQPVRRRDQRLFKSAVDRSAVCKGLQRPPVGSPLRRRERISRLTTISKLAVPIDPLDPSKP